MLEPLFYEAAGINPKYDSSGNITGFEKAPQTQAEKDAADITALQLSREKQALAGDLPVDPALTTQLDTQEKALKEDLLRQFGPDWASSTGGSQRWSDFQTMRTNTLDAARRGDISMYEGMSMLREQSNQQNLNNLLARWSMSPQMGYQAAGSFGTASQGASTALNYGLQQRQGSLMAQGYSASSPTMAQNWLAPMGSMLSSLYGAGMGAYNAYMGK